jgi:hypothetical protein
LIFASSRWSKLLSEAKASRSPQAVKLYNVGARGHTPPTLLF